MGCSNSLPTTATTEDRAQSTAAPSIKPSPSVPKMEYPPSEAYVINFTSDSEGNANEPATTSLTVSSNLEPLPQPPKRIQKLIEKTNTVETEDRTNTTTTKIEELEDKLNKAESRREAYLQEKIANIKKVAQP